MIATSTPTPATDLNLPQLADEYAEVRMRCLAWRPNVNPDQQRFDELAAELLARHSAAPSDLALQVQGEKYIVPISRREFESKISDKLALYRKLRRLGEAMIVDLYAITLGNARKVLTEKEREKFISTERCGPREIGEPVRRQEKAA